MKSNYIIGIDEVGRGALAGPVVVAAVVVVRGRGRVADDNLGKLRDSKKLSAKQREAWFGIFKSRSDIKFTVARVYPRRIEKLNISGAANLAAGRACRNLMEHGMRSIEQGRRTDIFLDGGLYLRNRKTQELHHPNAKTVIKADEKIPAVAIASIIAKVYRDRFMRRLSKKCPGYGFELHKGYGTRAHYAALRRHGPSLFHRLTFLRKRASI